MCRMCRVTGGQAHMHLWTAATGRQGNCSTVDAAPVSGRIRPQLARLDRRVLLNNNHER
jgi:hypothetical protein